MKMCSDSPHNAISVFVQGVKEFSIALLRAVTPDGMSLYKIFGSGDESRGKEVIREISEHPELSGGNRSCACKLLSMTDTADPNEKIVVIKRAATVEDDVRDYKRSFRVHFGDGNCVLTVEPVESKWERIVG
ncbi:MAG: hypothetical protein WCT41_03935 [Candidatus Paceibacterota bacterium]